MVTQVTDFDLIQAAELRERGSLKWTMFPDTIGAFVAEMDFGTAPQVTAALQRAVDAAVFGYLPQHLAEAMSEATAEWHRSAYGWDLRASQVHPIADVLKGLELAIEHFSAPGAPVILPTPSYMPFLEVPPEMGRKIIQIPLQQVDAQYALDLDALAAAYHQGGHLLILCNPYNPVGKVFGSDELVAISQVVAAAGGRVFADEIHSPVVYPGSVHVPYASISATTAQHTLTATSASKAWNLPGLKCAQLIISSAADAEIWPRIEMAASHGASTLGVIATTAAYRDSRHWLGEVLSYLDGNRRLLADLIAERLPGVQYTPPEGSYIGWLDCRGLGLGDQTATFFRERAGVSLTEGISCGAPGRGFVRMIFATPRPILEQAVAQMGAALKSR